MKIKTTKQMRLDELIKYIRENEIKVTEYVNNVGGIASFSYGQLSLRGGSNFIDIESPFKVPVEEELTEETELSAILTGVKSSDGRMVYRQHTSLSIARVKEEMALACIEPIVVYATDLNRPMNEITLIWSKDTGIPAEGVIECS